VTQRRATSTSNFGVGARESHDATAFYERFRAPDLTADTTILPPTPVEEPFVCGDARQMHKVADGSVALVVTSPPYFAGKQYEEELERDGIPATYLEYLQMLTDVFAECVRVLEPGGRIAVNVANLGRKPYRSLSADVIRILEDLGLLLRGEIVWQKAEGASGSCAWGSYRGAANPVLRDITERVVVASKGRFDRALSPKARKAKGLPHESTLMADDFMALTLDVWSIPAESARRVGHPAPFPVELPEQLIRLYTFSDDLVLDPFMGSGSSLVAASRLGRRYVGYDLDPEYVDIARQRVADEGSTTTEIDGTAPGVDGKAAAKLAAEVLTAAGFTDLSTNQRIAGSGTSVGLTALDHAGRRWCFDVAGGHVSHRGGLQRNEVVWKALGRAGALRRRLDGDPLVLLTTQMPRRGTEGEAALRSAGPDLLFDVVDLLDPAARSRLHEMCDGASRTPRVGFWTVEDLDGWSGEA
jgi:site-specific DNA-methyltransferase (adenine-specific)